MCPVPALKSPRKFVAIGSRSVGWIASGEWGAIVIMVVGPSLFVRGLVYNGMGLFVARVRYEDGAAGVAGPRILQAGAQASGLPYLVRLLFLPVFPPVFPDFRRAGVGSTGARRGSGPAGAGRAGLEGRSAFFPRSAFLWCRLFLPVSAFFDCRPFSSRSAFSFVLLGKLPSGLRGIALESRRGSYVNIGGVQVGVAHAVG